MSITVLFPTSPPENQQLVLTCTSAECRHTFEPDRVALASGTLACPCCDGWTFRAELAEPATTASGGGQ